MKVLVTDKINESAGKIIEPAAEVDFLPTMSEEELIKIIPNYDALMVRSQTKVTANIINAGVNLKILFRNSDSGDAADVEHLLGTRVERCQHSTWLRQHLQPLRQSPHLRVPVAVPGRGPIDGNRYAGLARNFGEQHASLVVMTLLYAGADIAEMAQSAPQKEIRRRADHGVVVAQDGPHVDAARPVQRR